MKSLPPVSPTILGYDLYFSMLFPIPFQSVRNTSVLPVKCNPAKFLSSNTTFEISLPLTVTILITPSGKPAAWNNSMITCAE